MENNNNNNNFNDKLINENRYIKNENYKIPFAQRFLEKNELKDDDYINSLNKNDFSEEFKESKKKMIILRIMKNLDNINDDGMFLLIEFIEKMWPEAVANFNDNIKINIPIMKEKEIINIEKYI